MGCGPAVAPLTGSLVCLRSAFCTCFSWSTSPGRRSGAGTDARSPTIQLILSHKRGQNKVSGCFFSLHVLKMVTRSSFHFFCPLCCLCCLNTELSPPERSKVAVRVPHLEARKGASLGRHRSELLCPAQGGSAGAAKPPGQLL